MKKLKSENKLFNFKNSIKNLDFDKMKLKRFLQFESIFEK